MDIFREFFKICTCSYFSLFVFYFRKLSGDQPVFCLYSDVSSSPRYTLYIVDSEQKCDNKFAIFIAPEGRYEFCI